MPGACVAKRLHGPSATIKQACLGFHRETVNAVAEAWGSRLISVHGSHELFTSSWLQARKAERQIGGILEACSSVRVLLETFWQMFDFVFS